jgi:ribonuclease P protein component
LTGNGAKFSFTRARRLGGRDAFASVFAYKCSVAGKYFQIYAKPNGHADSRLGITVNKKFVPQAAARNFCKRLARETFRLNRPMLGGVDMVVRARSVVLSASSAQARAEILDLMQRARQRCCDGAASSKSANSAQ